MYSIFNVFLKERPDAIYARENAGYGWFLPHSSYPSPSSSSLSNCDRYSSHPSSRSVRSVPYATQRSSRGVSSSSNSPPPPPPPSSGFLPLEPASPSVFASYPSSWQGSTTSSYWPTANPASPVGKRANIYLKKTNLISYDLQLRQFLQLTQVVLLVMHHHLVIQHTIYLINIQ